jgi:hypothetical protein
LWWHQRILDGSQLYEFDTSYCNSSWTLTVAIHYKLPTSHILGDRCQNGCDARRFGSHLHTSIGGLCCAFTAVGNVASQLNNLQEVTRATLSSVVSCHILIFANRWAHRG